MADEAGVARYTYRLRLSSSARRMLLVEWDRCRWVWNQCVAQSRETHRHNHENPDDPRTCGPAQLDKLLTGWRAGHVWLRAGSSVAEQQVIREFGASRAKALKDVRERVPQRRRAGMPRFKKRSLAKPTLNYTRRGFRLRDGALQLAGGIVVRPVWSRDLPAAPSSVRVYRDGLGHWYCSFVVNTRVQALPETGWVIGVDWGVRELATTTSDAYDLPHPEHGKSAAARLARYQRMMARRRPPKGRPGSKGYQHAKRQAAKIQKKIARRRQDTGRKWAKRVVRDHDALAVEDFRPKFLARSAMARKSMDAAIGATKRELIAMARKHGRDLRLVDPKHTTMDCAACGARAKHALPLHERIYSCTSCGAVSPRDKNSAAVMLVRAGLNPVGDDGTRPARPPDEQAA
ncbi:RNA-guided endonuclease InsQ/TnpB family protein [Lentzea sp. NPDC092896]|uniref:RNA-guided endonuclease InsQ/TnpB family protein n=1 Tax=Lentzea sp. NPDC092896 TaxID=3364127 RepID=UPI0037F85917